MADFIHTSNPTYNYWMIQRLFQELSPGVTNTQLRQAMINTHVPSKPFKVSTNMLGGIGRELARQGIKFKPVSMQQIANLSRRNNQRLNQIVSIPSYAKSSVGKLVPLTSVDMRSNVSRMMHHVHADNILIPAKYVKFASDKTRAQQVDPRHLESFIGAIRNRSLPYSKMTPDLRIAPSHSRSTSKASTVADLLRPYAVINSYKGRAPRRVYYLDRNNNVRIASVPRAYVSYDYKNYYHTLNLSKKYGKARVRRGSKQIGVRAMHRMFNRQINRSNHPINVLEVSSVSREANNDGYGASSSQLKTSGNKGYNVESMYQASKVFLDRNGHYHQYKGLLNKNGYDAMMFTRRLRRQGVRVAGFNPLGVFNNKSQVNIPRRDAHLDYDWFYIMTMARNRKLGNQIANYQAFGNMYFNPNKAVNDQARASAVYASLSRKGLLSQAVDAGRRGDFKNFNAVLNNVQISADRVHSNNDYRNYQSQNQNQSHQKQSSNNANVRKPVNDIFKSHAQALVIPVNTSGRMVAGLAGKANRKLYGTGLFGFYRKRAKNNTLDNRGPIVWPGIKFGYNHDIILFPIKGKQYRNPSNVNLIKRNLRLMVNNPYVKNLKSIAMPVLGTGRGHLKTSQVAGMLKATKNALDNEGVKTNIIHYKNGHQFDMIMPHEIVNEYALFGDPHELATAANTITDSNTKTRYYTHDMVDAGRKVLEHLTDIGATYSLEANPKYRNGNLYWNLDATNINGTKSSVRILDGQNNIGYAGRIKTSRDYTGYYVNDKNGKNANRKHLSDYIAGSRNARILRNGSGNSFKMFIDGDPKDMNVLLHAPNNVARDLSSSRIQLAFYIRNKALAGSSVSARNNTPGWKYYGQWYLNNETNRAKSVYTSLLLGDDLKGSNDMIASDQRALQQQIRQDPEIMHAHPTLGRQSQMDAFINKVSNYSQNHKSDNGIYDKVIKAGNALATKRIGSYDISADPDGNTVRKFDPSLVIRLNKKVEVGNPKNKMYVAMMLAGVSKDNIMNVDANTQTLDHLIRFNYNDVQYRAGMDTDNLSTTGKEKVGILNYVQDSLNKSGISGTQTYRSIDNIPKPQVSMDNHGIIRWSGYRLRTATKKLRADIQNKREENQYPSFVLNGSNGKPIRGFYHNVNQYIDEPISGEIGQVFVPDQHHILRTSFNSGDNKEIIPMSKAFFQYEGLNKGDPRMNRLAIINYDTILKNHLHSAINSQISRDPLSYQINDVTSPRDDAILNGLYTSDVAGKIYRDGWYEHSHLGPNPTADEKARSKKLKDAIIDTIYTSTRFPTKYNDMSTTLNIYRMHHNPIEAVRENAKAISSVTGHRNMRNLSYFKTDKKGQVYVFLDEKTHLPLLDSRDNNGNFRVLRSYIDRSGNKHEVKPMSEAIAVPKTVVKKLNLRPIPEYDGVFDTSATATGKRQGLKLYRAKGSRLVYDSKDNVYRIKPVPTDFTGNEIELDENGNTVKNLDGTPKYVHQSGYIPRCPLRSEPFLKYDGYNSADRRSAIFNVIMDSERIAPNAHALASDFGGWTFDDSIVISKNFADHYKVHPADADGNPIPNKWRPLRRGDKLSDFGFNKFTIGLIVDPQMSDAKAKKLGLTKEVNAFRQNPGLDCVMAPYAHMTRTNPSVDLEAASKHKHNKMIQVKDPDTGKVKTLGPAIKMNLVITNKLADEQSSAYTDSDVRHNKGNKLSNQGVWTINSIGDLKHDHSLNIIPQAFFEHNGSNWSKFREYALATGLDISRGGFIRPSNGVITVGRGKPYKNKKGQVIHHELGYEDYYKGHGKFKVIDGNLNDFSRVYTHRGELRHKYTANPNDSINKHYFKNGDQFIHEIGSHGGELYLPKNIKIRMASGIDTNSIPVMGHNVRRTVSMLRDGQIKISDYNIYYKQIFDTISKYYDKNSKLYHDDQHCQERVQDYYNSLQNEVIDKVFGGKTGEYNKTSFIRRNLMDVRAKHSAYDVATVDPRLNIDEIKVDPRTYHDLGMDHKDRNGNYDRKNDYVLVHRDPCISSMSSRAFKVVEDPGLIGMTWKQLSQVKDLDKLPTGTMQMNPFIDSMFNGDFDGDHYGIKYVSHNPKVQRALRKMSIPYNLLKPGTDSPQTVTNMVSMDGISDAISKKKAQPSLIGHSQEANPISKDSIDVGLTNYDNRKIAKANRKIYRDKDGSKKSLIDVYNDMAYTPRQQKAIKVLNSGNKSPKSVINTQLVRIVSAAGKLAEDGNDKNIEKLLNTNKYRLSLSDLTPKSSDKDKNKVVSHIADVVKKAHHGAKNPLDVKYNIAGDLTDDYIHDVTRSSSAYGSAVENITGDSLGAIKYNIIASYARIVASGAKGNPLALNKFTKHLEGQRGMQASSVQQTGDGVKSDLTGMIGAKTQGFEMIVHNNHADLNNPTGQLSNGNLQIKHHTDTAPMIMDAIINRYPSLAEGVSIYDGKTPLNGAQYKHQFQTVAAENQTPISNKYADKIELMVTDNQAFYGDGIGTKSDPDKTVANSFERLAIEHGAPLDLISYRSDGLGGFKTLRNLAMQSTEGQPRSMFEGYNTRSMIPSEGRNAYYLEADNIMKAQEKDPLLSKAVHKTYQNKVGKTVYTNEYSSIRKGLANLKADGITSVNQLGKDEMIDASNQVSYRDPKYHTVLDDEAKKSAEASNAPKSADKSATVTRASKASETTKSATSTSNSSVSSNSSSSISSNSVSTSSASKSEAPGSSSSKANSKTPSVYESFKTSVSAKHEASQSASPKKPQSASSKSVASSSAEPVKVGNVDINKANAKDLSTLKGVGGSRAKKIVDYRNAHGSYANLDSLKQVSGIGASFVNKLWEQNHAKETADAKAKVASSVMDSPKSNKANVKSASNDKGKENDTDSTKSDTKLNESKVNASLNKINNSNTYSNNVGAAFNKLMADKGESMGKRTPESADEKVDDAQVSSGNVKEHEHGSMSDKNKQIFESLDGNSDADNDNEHEHDNNDITLNNNDDKGNDKGKDKDDDKDKGDDGIDM